jgi:LysM repeat protein
VYSTAVAVGATETIKAIAYKTGVTDSTVASALYTINLPVVAAPTFNPPAEPVVAGTQVTIASATTGALISYTTDGSTPSATNGVASPVTVTVSAAETINAIAYKSGMTNSAVASAPYTMAAAVATPTFNPPAGPVVAGTQVTIASAITGALISYTTDGSTPSATNGVASPVTVTVSAAETINAIAYKTGMAGSAVASATYAISTGVNGYSHQRAITIPRNNMGILGGPMRDFPMLVSGTYSFLATTANRGQVQNANGFDIVFTADSAGTTKLDHEINSYDPTTGAINMWVRIPSLQYCDTVFFINYGNVAITTSQENKAGVWKSHYNAVLHMGETDGNLLYDSTGNGNNATKVSATSPSPVSGGLFGVAQSFNGTSDYAILPPSLTAGHKSFVLSFWVNTTELGAGDTNGHYYSAE